jgi:hypothetical protein
VSEHTPLYFEAARLRAPGQVSAGVAYGYRGRPSWIFVDLDPRYRPTAYTAELVMASGRRVPLPDFHIDRATGSAGQAIPVDLHDVSSIRLVGRARGDVLEVTLPHARPR